MTHQNDYLNRLLMEKRSLRDYILDGQEPKTGVERLQELFAKLPETKIVWNLPNTPPIEERLKELKRKSLM